MILEIDTGVAEHREEIIVAEDREGHAAFHPAATSASVKRPAASTFVVLAAWK